MAVGLPNEEARKVAKAIEKRCEKLLNDLDLNSD